MSHHGDRQFEVVVPRPRKPALLYPPMNGDKALRNMETLTGRGFKPIARTTANGITETLTLQEMREVYLSPEPSYG